MPEKKTKDVTQTAMERVQERFGSGSIMRLGKGAETQAIPVYSSASPSLDEALGGGYPEGRMTEIFGPEGSGKTTLSLHGIASCQAKGGTAAFVDAEHALSPAYAANLGVQLEDLLVSQPGNGEEALETVDLLVQSGVQMVVVDSVAALVPRAELEGEMGDTHVALQARLMSQALRKLAGSVSRSRTALLFINQVRSKVGVVYGNPEVTAGGNALKFYASVRLRVRRIKDIKKGEQIVGNRTKVRVVKNKVAPPYREAEFDILYGEGISREGDLIDLAVQKGVLEKSGAWFSFSGKRVGQGKENARENLKADPALRDAIEAAVRA